MCQKPVRALTRSNERKGADLVELSDGDVSYRCRYGDHLTGALKALLTEAEFALGFGQQTVTDLVSDAEWQLKPDAGSG